MSASLVLKSNLPESRLFRAYLRFLITFPFERVTVSIGVADSQGQACQAEGELLRLADGALYAAKRAGRNRVAQALFEVGEPVSR